VCGRESIGRVQRGAGAFGVGLEGGMRIAINLLPVVYRRQQIVRKRVIQWTTIVCAVVAVGWGWHWLERREELLLSQQLDSLEREHTPTRTMFKQIVNMRQQLDELHQQENVARELEYQRNALALLGVISETAEASKGRVQVTSVEVTGFQSMQAVKPAEGQEQVTEGVVVRGVSLDNPAVADMLGGLQDSGMFSRVEVVMKERAEGDLSLRDYELRCEY
jgi:Tfp pilus assembly protein PilN